LSTETTNKHTSFYPASDGHQNGSTLTATPYTTLPQSHLYYHSAGTPMQADTGKPSATAGFARSAGSQLQRNGTAYITMATVMQ